MNFAGNVLNIVFAAIFSFVGIIEADISYEFSFLSIQISDLGYVWGQSFHGVFGPLTFSVVIAVSFILLYLVFDFLGIGKDVVEAV